MLITDLRPDDRTRKLQAVKDRVLQRNGMVRVEEPMDFRKRRLRCSCAAPCGYRNFPGVTSLKNLQHSDIMGFLRRVWAPATIKMFMEDVRRLQNENRVYRQTGILTKRGMVLLQRLPGPLARALMHDFPAEFSPQEGAYTKEAAESFEKILGEMCINRQFTKRPGGAW